MPGALPARTVEVSRPRRTENVMNTTTTTSRALVAAAALAFPLLAATTAAAQAGPDDPSKALVEHRESQLAQADGQRAAQASRQQSYVDGLERAAAADDTAARAARAAYAAQQRSYQEHRRCRRTRRRRRQRDQGTVGPRREPPATPGTASRSPSQLCWRWAVWPSAPAPPSRPGACRPRPTGGWPSDDQSGTEAVGCVRSAQAPSRSPRPGTPPRTARSPCSSRGRR